jgi:hypothetical protein
MTSNPRPPFTKRQLPYRRELSEVFTPEDISEEQRMFARTAEEFLRKESFRAKTRSMPKTTRSIAS